MLFTDEEVRDDFHKTPLLLQVVCQVLESKLAESSFQAEVMDCAEKDGLWMALLACGHDNDVEDKRLSDTIPNAVTFTNARFKRKDGKPTLTLAEEAPGLVTVQVTLPHGFDQLN